MGGPLRVWMRWLEVGVVQQAELPVVDQLVLLALAQRLDGQPELLLGLVHRLVVEVGDPAVDPQHGLRDAQLVLARAQLVVDERAGQHGLAAVAGGQLDLGLAVVVLRPLTAGLPGLAGAARRLGDRSSTACEVLAGQGQHGAGGHGLRGELPLASRSSSSLLAEVVAVGQHAEHRSSPYAPVADLVDLAVRDQARPGRSGRLADDHLAGPELALDEPVGERGQHLHVLEAAQQRQLAELRGDRPAPPRRSW